MTRHADDQRMVESLDRGAVLASKGRFAEAIKYFDRAIRLAPDAPMPHMYKAMALKDLGRIQEAVDSLEWLDLESRRYFERNNVPADEFIADALQTRGAVLRLVYRPVEALRMMKRSRELDPANSNAVLGVANTLADIYEMDGDEEKAAESLRVYDEAIRLNENFAPTFANKGILLTKLGRHDEARRCLERAILIDPGHAQGYYGMGLLLDRLGEEDAATEYFKGAGRADPRFLHAIIEEKRREWMREKYGKVARSKHKDASAMVKEARKKCMKADSETDLEIALILCEVAISISPCMNEAYELRDLVIDRISFERSLKDEMIESDHINEKTMSSFNSIVNRETGYSMSGRYKKALSCTEEMISMIPEYIGGHMKKAEILFKLERYEDVLDTTAMVNKMAPKLVGAYKLRFNALLKRNNIGDRVACCNEMLLLNQHDTITRNNRIIGLRKLHEYDKVIDACDEAITRDPKNTRAHVEKMAALVELGRHGDAVRYVKEAQSHTDDPHILIAAGELFEEAGMHEESARCYEKAKIYEKSGGRYEEAATKEYIDAFSRALGLDPDSTRIRKRTKMRRTRGKDPRPK